MTERLHFHFSLSCIGEGNGHLLQCSCLENPRDGGAWWAAVYGVTQSRTRLKRPTAAAAAAAQWVNVLISCGCHNELSQTCWLQTAEIYSLTVLPLAPNQGVDRAILPPKAPGGTIPCLVHLLEAPKVPRLAASLPSLSPPSQGLPSPVFLLCVYVSDLPPVTGFRAHSKSRIISS